MGTGCVDNFDGLACFEGGRDAAAGGDGFEWHFESCGGWERSEECVASESLFVLVQMQSGDFEVKSVRIRQRGKVL